MSNWVDLPVPDRIRTPQIYEPLEWAKKNCPSYITNDAVQKQGEYYYRFFFGNEQDQIIFALRWL